LKEFLKDPSKFTAAAAAPAAPAGGKKDEVKPEQQKPVAADPESDPEEGGFDIFG
ncbi:unnamed protein product, partial [Didymodactylos carnosus]